MRREQQALDIFLKEDQRQDTSMLVRCVELLEALTDRDTAIAERQDHLNARQCGMLDNECEKAAGVFAELKEAGVG
uniref:hypothetical protein n=1 Tax=Corynebacterium jeikeium TaxID=38289 RepID=UPI0015690CC3|nr:hypothetical protein [Corynebacterium jeikeium]